MIRKYRKKPVVIEALQFTGENINEVVEFVGEQNLVVSGYNTSISSDFPVELTIRTLEGHMTASRYDYIIKGIQGEFYPCKPDIFVQTYEVAY